MFVIDEAAEISDEVWKAWKMNAIVERGRIIERAYKALFGRSTAVRTDYFGDIEGLGSKVRMSDGDVELTIDRAYPIGSIDEVEGFVEMLGAEIRAAKYFAAQCVRSESRVPPPYDIVFGTVGTRKEAGRMDFGQALVELKAGKRVARSGWNGVGMFVYLVPGSHFEVNRAPLLGIYQEGTPIDYRSHIDMKTVDGSCVPWVASQTDMLAEDWSVVEAPAA